MGRGCWGVILVEDEPGPNILSCNPETGEKSKNKRNSVVFKFSPKNRARGIIEK
jgi:hypothetical protein